MKRRPPRPEIIRLLFVDCRLARSTAAPPRRRRRGGHRPPLRLRISPPSAISSSSITAPSTLCASLCARRICSRYSRAGSRLCRPRPSSTSTCSITASTSWRVAVRPPSRPPRTSPTASQLVASCRYRHLWSLSLRERESLGCCRIHLFIYLRAEGLMNGASTSRNSLATAFSYCVQQVRNYDYQHYLCLLHLPPAMRKAAFALRAFNIETARAMDVASDPKIGLMRLLWWQEAIEKIFSNKLIEHPTARALSSVISEQKISKHWLKRSVEARINDASRDENAIPETIDDLEKYAEDTASTLLYLTLQAGGIRSTAADHAASHIGKASGLLLLLKSLPYHASRDGRISYLPADVAARHGLLVTSHGRSEIQMKSGEDLSDSVFEVASVANIHLQKARELAGAVPSEALPVLLPAVPAQVLLDSLRRCNFNVFDSRIARGVSGISPMWFQLKLKWFAWRNKY